MPLNRQFVRAKIEEKPNFVILTITYNWYYLMEFTETFVHDNLEQAKTRLLNERSHDHVTVLSVDGKDKGLGVL
jgi:hypothetical protein